LRLLHLLSHDSNNIGNAALSLGTRRVLQEDLTDATFDLEPWDEYNWAGTRRYADLIDRLNSNYDGMIVGAASIFDGSARYTDAGFRFNLPLPLWDSIQKPIVFYGVGYGCFPRQYYHNREPLRRTFSKILSHPKVVFTLRNDDAHQWLRRITNTDCRNALIVPDPAAYVPTKKVEHHELDPHRPNVLLSLNAEHPSYRFGGGWPQALWRHLPGWRMRKQRFLTQIAQSLEKIAARHPFHLVLVPHTPYDSTMIGEFVALCSPAFSTYHLTVSAVLKGGEGGMVHYDLYRTADVALCMRVHSQVCAVGLGTPMVSLASLPRMHAYMKDVGLAEYTLDVLDPEVGQKLERLLELLLTDPSAKARFSSVAPVLRERSAAFNAKLNAFLLGGPHPASVAS
jgi:polysaccharide pyruvyl transferase WcaK-like protein